MKETKLEFKQNGNPKENEVNFHFKRKIIYIIYCQKQECSISAVN